MSMTRSIARGIARRNNVLKSRRGKTPDYRSHIFKHHEGKRIDYGKLLIGWLAHLIKAGGKK